MSTMNTLHMQAMHAYVYTYSTYSTYVRCTHILYTYIPRETSKHIRALLTHCTCKPCTHTYTRTRPCTKSTHAQMHPDAPCTKFTFTCLFSLASKRDVKQVSWRSLKTCHMHTHTTLNLNTHNTQAHRRTHTHTKHMHTHIHKHTHTSTHTHTQLQHTRICTHRHTLASLSLCYARHTTQRLLCEWSTSNPPSLTCSPAHSLWPDQILLPQAPHQAIQLAYAVTHMNGNGL